MPQIWSKPNGSLDWTEPYDPDKNAHRIRPRASPTADKTATHQISDFRSVDANGRTLIAAVAFEDLSGVREMLNSTFNFRIFPRSEHMNSIAQEERDMATQSDEEGERETATRVRERASITWNTIHTIYKLQKHLSGYQATGSHLNSNAEVSENVTLQFTEQRWFSLYSLPDETKTLLMQSDLLKKFLSIDISVRPSASDRLLQAMKCESSVPDGISDGKLISLAAILDGSKPTVLTSPWAGNALELTCHVGSPKTKVLSLYEHEEADCKADLSRIFNGGRPIEISAISLLEYLHWASSIEPPQEPPRTGGSLQEVDGDTMRAEGYTEDTFLSSQRRAIRDAERVYHLRVDGPEAD